MIHPIHSNQPSRATTRWISDTSILPCRNWPRPGIKKLSIAGIKFMIYVNWKSSLRTCSGHFKYYLFSIVLNITATSRAIGKNYQLIDCTGNTHIKKILFLFLLFISYSILTWHELIRTNREYTIKL